MWVNNFGSFSRPPVRYISIQFGRHGTCIRAVSRDATSKNSSFVPIGDTCCECLAVHFLRVTVPPSIMALSNFGSLVLNLLIFLTTLVNFSYALTALEPLVLLALYAITKIFMTPPEDGIVSLCGLGYLLEAS
jgi:hypothetical protein